MRTFERVSLRIAMLFLVIFTFSACQTSKITHNQELHWRFISSPNQIEKVAHPLCGTIDSNFFAFGGIMEGSDSPFNSKIIFYDSTLETWKIIDNLNGPSARNFASLVTFGNSALVFGGESQGKPFSNDAFVYDFINARWNPIKNTLSTKARTRATATLVGTQVVIYGGKGDTAIHNWSRYDTETKQWATFENEGIDSRVSHIAIPIGDSQLFIWGGFIGMERQSNGLILNIHSNRILSIPSTSLLSARANARALTVKDKVYIWGGSSSDENSNSGAIFDLIHQKWEALPPIPHNQFTQLKGGEIVPWGDEGMLLIGGRFGLEGFNSKLWLLNFKTKVWTPLSLKTELPGRIAHCVSVLASNKIAVFGGIGFAEGTSNFKQFDGLWILSKSK